MDYLKMTPVEKVKWIREGVLSSRFTEDDGALGDDLLTALAQLETQLITVQLTGTEKPDYGPLKNANGITVKELKDFVRDLPEVDDYNGENFEVWVDGTDCKPGLTNVAKSIWKLNKGDLCIETVNQ